MPHEPLVVLIGRLRDLVAAGAPTADKATAFTAIILAIFGGGPVAEAVQAPPPPGEDVVGALNKLQTATEEALNSPTEAFGDGTFLRLLLAALPSLLDRFLPKK